jgi:hypothetical protein
VWVKLRTCLRCDPTSRQSTKERREKKGCTEGDYEEAAQRVPRLLESAPSHVTLAAPVFPTAHHDVAAFNSNPMVPHVVEVFSLTVTLPLAGVNR